MKVRSILKIGPFASTIPTVKKSASFHQRFIARSGQNSCARGKNLAEWTTAQGTDLLTNYRFFIDIGFDDLLDEKRSNATGYFMLDGFTRENSNIDPLLKIYHDCEDPLVTGFI